MFALELVRYPFLFRQCSLTSFLGNGLTYVPAVSIVSNTFTTKRPLAIGLVASGSAFGSTILPIIFRQLIPMMGFGWVNRVFGFLILTISLLAIVFLKPNTQLVLPLNAFFDVRTIKEPAYLLLCAGLFFVELGYWIPPFSLPPYAQFLSPDKCQLRLPASCHHERERLSRTSPSLFRRSKFRSSLGSGRWVPVFRCARSLLVECS